MKERGERSATAQGGERERESEREMERRVGKLGWSGINGFECEEGRAGKDKGRWRNKNERRDEKPKTVQQKHTFVRVESTLRRIIFFCF